MDHVVTADAHEPDERDADLDSGRGVSEDELIRQAMAADPDAMIDGDAVPWGRRDRDPNDVDLPDWYMPAVSGGLVSRRYRIAAYVIILALVLIVASGLCVTYGIVEVA